MNKKGNLYIFLSILIIIVLTGFSLGPIMSKVETPKFKILSTFNKIEIRAYKPMLIAEIDVRETRKEAVSQGFRSLADFIFGNNIRNDKIKMTAPVVQQSSEKIKMTAPVVQQSSSQGWKVSFVMPSSYTLHDIPKPLNNEIIIKEIPARKMAVIKFNGRNEEDNISKYENKLLKFMEQNNFVHEENPEYAFYNPPWTLPVLRRNEVMFEIKISMKKFIIYYLLFIYIIDAEALRSIKKDISPPSNIQYIIENYIENGDRSTEIGIAIHKDNLDSDIKLPTVVFIHGGGWRSGDKQQNAWQCFNYANKGFVAITISYRLLDEAPFPQCIIDVKTALRFIKSLSRKYPIDVENIGVWGYSAGAHLALMIALEDSSDLFNSGHYNAFDSKVKCAVAIAAPTYLQNRAGGKDKKLSDEQNNDEKFRAQISPITYVNSNQISIL